MTKKRLCVVVLAFIAVAAVGVVVWQWLPDGQAGVTKANFDRIEVGMTFDEVLEVFGKVPPTDVIGNAQLNAITWVSDSGAEATITYNNESGVVSKEWNSAINVRLRDYFNPPTFKKR